MGGNTIQDSHRLSYKFQTSQMGKNSENWERSDLQEAHTSTTDVTSDHCHLWVGEPVEARLNALNFSACGKYSKLFVIISMLSTCKVNWVSYVCSLTYVMVRDEPYHLAEQLPTSCLQRNVVFRFSSRHGAIEQTTWLSWCIKMCLSKIKYSLI